MIEELTIECDKVDIQSCLHGHELKVVVTRPCTKFIQNIELKDILPHHEVQDVLEAIGADVVGEWYMKLGSV